MSEHHFPFQWLVLLLPQLCYPNACIWARWHPHFQNNFLKGEKDVFDILQTNYSEFRISFIQGTWQVKPASAFTRQCLVTVISTHDCIQVQNKYRIPCIQISRPVAQVVVIVVVVAVEVVVVVVVILFPTQYNNTIQYSVHDYHNQHQSDHRYCYVIMLVATRETMGLSG